MVERISVRKGVEGVLTAALWAASSYVLFILFERLIAVFQFTRSSLSFDILVTSVISYVSFFFLMLFGVYLWNYVYRFRRGVSKASFGEGPGPNRCPAPVYAINLVDLQKLKGSKNIDLFLDKKSSEISIVCRLYS